MELTYLMSCYDEGMKTCNITDDLLVEILMRLPFKSLCRFKSVSKSWCRLISDNYLRQRLPPITISLFFRSESDQFKKARYAYTSSNGTIQECSLDFFPFDKKSTVVDGFNGLLLYYSSEQTTFYVVNTGMNLWVSLPKMQKAAQLSTLAFDPYSSADYRVVCFNMWQARGAELEIHSSETGDWDRREVKFGVKPDALSRSMHYFNSVLYILAYPNMIVAVNLKNLSCNLIQLPEPMNSITRVGHCQGRLHYAHINGNKVKIWMVNYLNRSSEWGLMLKHEIYLREIIGRRELNPNQVILLAFHPEKELMCVWVHNGVLVCYDLKVRRLVDSWKYEREKAIIQIWLFPKVM